MSTNNSTFTSPMQSAPVSAQQLKAALGTNWYAYLVQLERNGQLGGDRK